jgi:hypothetical protein
VPSDDRTRWEREKTVRVALLETIPGAGPVRGEMLAQVPSRDVVEPVGTPAGGIQ